MKQLFTVLLLLLFRNLLFAQDFEANVKEDTTTNYKTSFLEMHFTFNGFLVDDNYFSAQKSFGFEFGMSYKWKFTKILGSYIGLSFVDNNYGLKQDTAINFPSNTLYDKARIELGGIRLTPGITILAPTKKCNPSKIGISLYPFVEYYWSRNLVVEQKLSTSQPPFAKELETTFSKLSYINNFAYGIGGEITAYGISIGATYYLSDVVKQDFINNNNWHTFPNIKIYAKYLISLE